MASKARAEKYMADAEKATKRWSLFGGSSKYEDAAELFTKAGQQFKLAKDWENAAEAFSKAAESETKVSAEHEAAGHTADAGHCLKHVNPAEAVLKLQEAVEMYNDQGKFSQAAKLDKEVAEMYEESGNLDEATAHYRSAGDLFKGEGASSAAASCYLKVASFAGEAENYEEASELFDEIGREYVENRLLKFKAKEVFMNGIICHMAANDPVATQRAIDKYCELDYTFPDTRECKLCTACLGAMQDSDVDVFVGALSEFDRVSKLDPWRTKLLLRVREAIEDAGAVDLT